MRLYELWDSDEALAKHRETPHMAEFQKVMGAIKRRATAVRQFNCTEVPR